MKKLKDPLVWLRGLLAAVIGGGATSGSAWLGMAAAKQIGADVPALNVQALGVIFLSGAVTNLLAYLKQSPLPELEEVETTFITKTTVHQSTPKE